MLSAAWGPLMPVLLRSVWGYLGLFGLTAGLGLATLRHMRMKKQEEQRQRDAMNELARFDRIISHHDALNRTVHTIEAVDSPP
jgi:hypothetical protein